VAKTILIKSGRVVDPSQNVDAEMDILLEDGKVRSLQKSISTKAQVTIPAKGKLVLPGLIDIHVHLRDPGRPDKETIASGTRAAALGGFTTLACMPNTDPAIDTEAVVEYIISKAKLEGVTRVHPIACITKGRQGETLTEIGTLLELGAVAFSDDGSPVTDSSVMRRAFEYASQFGATIISHCEDIGLSSGGTMNEGSFSTKVGLKGINALSEEIMVARDLMLAKQFCSRGGAKLHIAHVSTAGSVELIRRAKGEGVAVTCETAPHYFTLTEQEVEGYNTNAKVNPPLRTEKDVAAIVKGLKDGTIDAIATDHAPHTIEEKNIEFGRAASGMIGLETALSLTISELVLTDAIPLKKAIEKLTSAPARILGLNRGTLKIGSDADLTIVDPQNEYTYDVSKSASKSRNTPFAGWKLKGSVEVTIVGGNIVVKAGKLAV
jgi:dihydroorotase